MWPAGARGLVDEGVVADVMVAGLGLRKLESELVLSSPINFIKDGGGYVAIGNFPKGEHRGLIILFFHVWVPPPVASWRARFEAIITS